jgi:hypothetical protein
MTSSLFLTAYDPTDLPGGSVDPLGFDRGYTALAERLLPGLTNVASAPRYFSMLCAASEVVGAVPMSRAGNRDREKALLRFERLWALALVLASKADGFDSNGLRGVSFATRVVADVDPASSQALGSRFDLLKRQTQAGAIGIYGAVAVRLQLWADRRTMRVTEDWGKRLGRAYLDGTECPASVRKAALDPLGTVPAAELTGWGRRAHLLTPTTKEEAKVLHEIARRDPVRANMLDLLAAHPGMRGEPELTRLARIRGHLEHEGVHPELRQALGIVAAFESGYQHVLLVLERLLACCDRAAVPMVSTEEISADVVLRRALDGIGPAVAELEAAIAEVDDAKLLEAIPRLHDVRRFLERAGAASTALELVDAVLARHREVQAGKFDGGRRKAPWLEHADGRVRRTLTTAGQARNAEEPTHITPHFYRCSAGDALNEAAHVR